MGEGRKSERDTDRIAQKACVAGRILEHLGQFGIEALRRDHALREAAPRREALETKVIGVRVVRVQLLGDPLKGVFIAVVDRPGVGKRL